MTGSALTRWTLHVACDSLSEGSKGGWFGRGKGLAGLHYGRLADFLTPLDEGFLVCLLTFSLKSQKDSFLD